MPSRGRTRVASRALRPSTAARSQWPRRRRTPMAKLQRLAMGRDAFPPRTFEEERIVNQTGTQEHDAEQDTRRLLRTVATATALTGGPLFLLGVLLHPARDGAGIAAAGQTYGITHGVEAIGLLLVAVSLVSAYALDAASLGRRGLWAFLAAVVGT